MTALYGLIQIDRNTRAVVQHLTKPGLNIGWYVSQGAAQAQADINNKIWEADFPELEWLAVPAEERYNKVGALV